MQKLIKLKMLHSAAILIVTGIFLLLFMSCKNTTTPEEDDYVEAKVIITNECGTAVDVSMDGIYQFSLDNGVIETIERVIQGTHTFEAHVEGTETLISSETYDIEDGFDYYWTVEPPSTITITNAYGEDLQIYVNGAYQGDIGDTETESITQVPFGSYNLEAVDSNSNIVASVIITVSEVKEYFWTITP
jgi:hypothetical protein